VGMKSDERNGADSPLVSAHPIRVIDARQLGVGAVVEALARSPAAVPPEIHRAVDRILADVRARGDAALLELTARFDGFTAATPTELVITPDEFETAERRLAPEVRAALAYAAERIERYHAVAAPKSWRLTDEHGSVLGQEVRALDRVGIYAPGGRAAYPSTVLMTAVPARVAGAREVGIDMVAGPSEIVVVADGAADPAWVAADMLAQAEHDPMARALCITDAADLLARVAAALERQLATLPRREIAARALEANGALI